MTFWFNKQTKSLSLKQKILSIMKYVYLLCLSCLFVISGFSLVCSQNRVELNNEIALQLSKLPLSCINQEYPNKTGHIINNADEANLSPKELHPVFYGCFDWHSSVHGHWMLVRLLKKIPDISNRDEIIKTLNNSFVKEKIEKETQYFSDYQFASIFERTYGWAWVLKLDEELSTWDEPVAKRWHENLAPLTKKIVELWISFLPKQTYPNRTGVHPNTAFALGFAIDWAKATCNVDFEKQLIEKALYFYVKDTETPAHLEPDGADFFSPSLQTADLMQRVLEPEQFSIWIDNFFTKRSIDRLCEIPEVSDLNDFQTVHLVGLSFSRAWCMNNIAQYLPNSHPLKQVFSTTSQQLLSNALPLVFEGNYGGEHWLASFAIMALE